AGIFNGNGRNITVNDNNNFMFAGRLKLQPFKGKVFGQPSFLKLGGDVLNSRDEAGVNISQSSNLLVNDDGSLSPFVLPSADERTAWSVDAWLELGPFDLSVNTSRNTSRVGPATACRRRFLTSRRTDFM